VTYRSKAANHGIHEDVYGYQARTLRGTSIWDKCHHKPGDGGDAAASLPFYIGPLTRYTVIELLSQPLFFFRRPADLDHTKPLVPARRAVPSIAEMNSSDTNGDVHPSNIDIIWTTNQPQTPLVPRDSLLEEDKTIEYNDDWVDDNGEIIGSSCHYLDIVTGEVKDKTQLDAINSVLLGINDRQANDQGFSVHLGGTTLRPGRGLMIPHRHMLLIIQTTADGNFTVNVLDPIV
jgi:hypothetical protein